MSLVRRQQLAEKNASAGRQAWARMVGRRRFADDNRILGEGDRITIDQQLLMSILMKS